MHTTNMRRKASNMAGEGPTNQVAAKLRQYKSLLDRLQDHVVVPSAHQPFYKLGGAYLTVGGVFAGCGFRPLWVASASYGWFVLAFYSVSFIIMGVVHLWDAHLGSRVLCKDANTGRLHPVIVLIFLPYYLLHWVVWVLRQRVFLRKDPDYQMVFSGVFLGRYPTSVKHIPPSTSLVVDVTSEFPKLWRSEAIAYKNLACLDTTMPNEVMLLQIALETLVFRYEALLAHGVVSTNADAGDEGRVFVHCANGRGRSAAVVAMLILIEGLSDDVEEAARLLHAKRPQVHLHKNQADLVRSASVLMEQLQGHETSVSPVPVDSLRTRGDFASQGEDLVVE